MSGWETTTLILAFLFVGCAVAGWVMVFRAVRDWRKMREAHEDFKKTEQPLLEDDDE